MAFRLRQGVVVSVNYLVKEDKFEFEHLPWFGWASKTEKVLVDPGHLTKVKKAAMNPFAGYRNSKTGRNYATKGTVIWHNRQIFDSIIAKTQDDKKQKRTDIRNQRMQARKTKDNKRGSPFD
mmetsp:Transcript_6967/g.6145  ORF Transcript_6967/g.6145 Transcript_6967/m.6145 type:complete len:122 (-) Transcript_6967:19-384(-)